MSVPDLEWSRIEAMAGSAQREAAANNWPVAVAIVDRGGHLRYAARYDGAIAPAAVIAIAKARTAALYCIPSGMLEDMAKDRPAMGTLPDALAVKGGLPIVSGGVVVGGIGVSGGTSEQDTQIAEAGLKVL